MDYAKQPLFNNMYKYINTIANSNEKLIDKLRQNKRVAFLSFDELITQYEQEMQREQIEFTL